MGGINGDVIAITQHKENLYHMTFTEVWRANVANIVSVRVGGNPVKLWHHQLGYLDVRSVSALQTMVRSMNVDMLVKREVWTPKSRAPTNKNATTSRHQAIPPTPPKNNY